MTALIRPWHALVCALVAIALTGVAFAHRPMVSAAQQRVMLAAYALPGGVLPDLCRAAGEEGVERPCDACRLTLAPGLPAQLSAHRLLLFGAGLCRPAPLAAVMVRHEAGFSARAPPAWIGSDA